ncbi:hypothetical protein [Clostridium butyricum]|uniref:hypothetical protein n=1 Tax=Clostridium butyricum TaxID=1492 RepID=UPI0006E58D59|nr:hypothetical protein AK964_17985 [Clostridium butyricum]MBS5946179.1 hypothetical protein [Peptoniphilus harei]
MSKELDERCIKYGIVGNAQDFLENIEQAYDSLAEAEKENDDEPTMSMVEWIDENVNNAGPEVEKFTEEQMFFFGMGLLSSEIMDRLNL